LCDFVRSYSSGFIFTTALPPHVAAGALASVRYVKSSSTEREAVHSRVASLRCRLDDIGIPHLRNRSHIVPVMVGKADLCRQISDILLNEYDIYIQPINYPTVPRGTERLRITASPFHSPGDIEHLTTALAEIWSSPLGEYLSFRDFPGTGPCRERTAFRSVGLPAPHVAETDQCERPRALHLQNTMRVCEQRPLERSVYV
jgi:5-aminolevulinate synthase